MKKVTILLFVLALHFSANAQVQQTVRPVQLPAGIAFAMYPQTGVLAVVSGNDDPVTAYPQVTTFSPPPSR